MRRSSTACESAAKLATISRHEDVLRLVRGQQVTSQNYGDGLGLIFGQTVLELDGREHQRQRTLLNPIFHTVEVERLRPMMLDVIRRMFLPELAAAKSEAKQAQRAFAELDLVPTYFWRVADLGH
jgi:pulcherriminic acid synthase